MGDTDSARRSQLLSLKLRALVRGHLGVDVDPPGKVEPFALGSAYVTDDAVWVLVDGDTERSLGPVLAWAARFDAPVHLLVERGSGLLARRALGFTRSVTVWHVDDRTLLPAVAEPHLLAVAADERHAEFIPLIESSGADALVEHGVVVGEIRGLEMCRVVDDEFTGGVRLEVGMGRHDREAFSMIHGELPTTEALSKVIDAVLPHRTEGADPHPFNQFGAERLLRWRVMQNPGLIGFSTLTAIEPPVLRTNVKDPIPCVAAGIDAQGNESVVVFVHGVDLDVVPFAIDAAMRHGSSNAVVVARDKDIVPSIRSMAAISNISLSIRSIDE